ncbi:hypothetical protein DMN91_011623 [Ooceraea biroi]|uniref:DNA repair and recombination protein RAD54-like n=2 Tax=Ooceraea biroi TaxID=2015173 RepID=A0A3L8D5W5_OOCBI|nr:DNA repair and recombination protein RAD54B isoform X1 [Ooceraea biroi]RLU15867.1 hypothetical protein DMN91_011623 [Ooceraea biroi]
MSLRSNTDILRLFEKASRANTDNNVKSEDNSSRKRDTVVSIRSEETPAAEASATQVETKLIFSVVYGKVTSKKRKTWSGDGLLEVTGKTAVLRDLEGNVMGRTVINPHDATEGFTLIIGNRRIEIIERVSQDPSVMEKLSNEPTVREAPQKRCKVSTFVRNAFVSPERQSSTEKAESVVDATQARTKMQVFWKQVLQQVNLIFSRAKYKYRLFCSIFNVMYGKVSSRKHKTWDNDGLLEVIGKSAILMDSSGSIIGRATVNPLNVVEGSTLIVQNKQVEVTDRVSQQVVEPEKRSNEVVKVRSRKGTSTSAFVPLLSTAREPVNCEPLVMPYTSPAAILVSDEDPQKEQEVSVDFCLTAKLRKHQRHGVVFLYECLMGLRAPDYLGAILADDMGLGKTLQCITLIWTLLKKGPRGKPILKRILIITPSSLCQNWDKEFVKWLGSHRMSAYVVDGKSNKPKDFTKHPMNTVMIVSYEMLMRCHAEISEIAFDLIVCDEGHRLKNSNVKAAKLLNELDCKRRILLTGTPIQNDLKEFYALVDFVNPGILGTPAEYKGYYEDPIVASQCPRANAETLCLGNERATELHELTKRFILRRTQETINQYLPHKHEMVLFCSLSSRQRDLYVHVTDAWFNKICMQDKSNMHLSVVTALKKVCNHPNLFVNDKESTQYLLPQATTNRQKEQDDNFTEYCGKVTVVQTLMRNLKRTEEKLVLVSYYTQTLDLLETVCGIEGLEFSRLDGTTLSSTRSKIIEQFNTRTDESKVFLLSAKAGGVGLNLSGASRLVLFDSDWNPASDAQAMARIWRDGQKRDVYIYRLLTTGTIEEKIYQRQISKAGLSESVVDLNHLGSLKLSIEELKDLFTLATDTVSLTHDLMNCPCSGRNNEHVSSVERNEEHRETRDCQLTLRDKTSQPNLTINQLLEWQHYKQPFPVDLMQNIMLTEVANDMTYIFKSSTVPLSQHAPAN